MTADRFVCMVVHARVCVCACARGGERGKDVPIHLVTLCFFIFWVQETDVHPDNLY